MGLSILLTFAKKQKPVLFSLIFSTDFLFTIFLKKFLLDIYFQFFVAYFVCISFLSSTDLNISLHDEAAPE